MANGWHTTAAGRAERERRALALRAEGLGFKVIGERLGISDTNAADLVKRAARRAEAGPAEKKPTAAQLRVLELVRRHVAEQGSSPTLRELRDAYGCASTYAITCHLRALVARGLVRVRAQGKARQVDLVEPPCAACGDERCSRCGRCGCAAAERRTA